MVRKHLVTSLAAGAIMLLGAGVASATPIVYLGTLANVTPVAGVNMQAPGSEINPEGADYWQFNAVAGANVDVFGDRQAGHYDMSFLIFRGTFADTAVFGGSFTGSEPGFIAFGDDDDPPNIPGPFGDPHVSFIAPVTGSYTIVVTNFASSSQPPNPYTLQARGVSDPVPEPASMVLLGTGLAGIAVAARRRARKS